MSQAVLPAADQHKVPLPVRPLDVQEVCFERHRTMGSANLLCQGVTLDHAAAAARRPIDIDELASNIGQLRRRHCALRSCSVSADGLQLVRVNNGDDEDEEEDGGGDGGCQGEPIVHVVDDLDAWITESAARVLLFGEILVAVDVDRLRYAVVVSHMTMDGLSIVALVKEIFNGTSSDVPVDNYTLELPGVVTRIGFSAADVADEPESLPDFSTITPDCPKAERSSMKFKQKTLEVPSFRSVDGITVNSILLACCALALDIQGSVVIGAPQDTRKRLTPIVPPHAIGNFALPGGVVLNVDSSSSSSSSVMALAAEAQRQVQQSLSGNFSSAIPILEGFVRWIPPEPIHERGPDLAMLLTNVGFVRDCPVSINVGVSGLYNIGFFLSAATVQSTLYISIGYNEPYISQSSALLFIDRLRYYLNPCSRYRPGVAISLIEDVFLGVSSRMSVVTFTDGKKVVVRYPGSCSAEYEYEALKRVEQLSVVPVPSPLYYEPNQRFFIQSFVVGEPNYVNPNFEVMGNLLRSLHDAGIVHGDFWGGNVMFDTESGVVTAVVDWEDCQLVSPHFNDDLANSLVETCTIYGSQAMQPFLTGYSERMVMGDLDEVLLVLIDERARRLFPNLKQYANEWAQKGRPDLSQQVLETRCSSLFRG